MSDYPSGQQFPIAYGSHRATVVEVGAGIRDYTLGDAPVLDGYPAERMCSGARGTPLIPWPNRLEDGAYRFDGHDHQLPLTEPETHNAIHGLTRWQNWQLREFAGDRVALGLQLRPQPGYPFSLHLLVDYRLGEHGLTVSTTATNFGDTRCPYACGQHPYLTVGTEFIDTCQLELDACNWLPVDERGLPTGCERVVGSHLDFRERRAIGDTVIDNAYTGLARDTQQRAWLTLSGPDGRTVRLWVDEHYRYLELYTGDTQPADAQRRGLGVEPMTCPPNGFATGERVLVLDPGQSITTRWGITPTPDSEPRPQ